MGNDLLALFAPAGAALTVPNKPVRAVGIDLGTTNSTLAEVTWMPGQREFPSARCVEVEQETLEGVAIHTLVPSIVAFHDGRMWVGEGAKRLRARAAELQLRQEQNLFYDCKNDMGVRKTYHRAPEGCRSAAEVGGQVLRFLNGCAAKGAGEPVSRAVVTVPASFQAAQRKDTRDAASRAGMNIKGGDLLDEPVAAFLDYLVGHRETFAGQLTGPKNLLVFDFGGGTCDVAVLAVQPLDQDRLAVSPRAVSRYHRLGGGDIDAAILYEVLLPQLLEQNPLPGFSPGFTEKKKLIEPALLGIAEALKIGLSIQIRRLRSFGKYETADKTQIVKVVSGQHPCKVGDHRLLLQSPSLSAAQFEALLKPFLDRDSLTAVDTEYRMTASVFAPLDDALNRAELNRGDIDFCLLVGGSTLIPQVEDAIRGYFVNAKLLTYEGSDAAQTAVARGAAYHALSLALFGVGLIQPVCQDDISIRTTSGLVTLVRRGTRLPFPPADEFEKVTSIAVPESVLVGNCDVKVELLASHGGVSRTLLDACFAVPGPVNEGTPLLLEYRYDQNQVFDVKLSVRGTDAAFDARIESPLTNVVNPQVDRLKIAETEENLRLGRVERHLVPDTFAELAGAYGKIGQHEKAIDYLRQAIRQRGRPDSWLLDRLAGEYAALGDVERAERFYLEASRCSGSGGSLFNLSLYQHRRGEVTKAGENIDEALRRDRSAPYLVQKARVADAMGDAVTKAACLTEALTAFGQNLRALDDWRLAWLQTAAGMQGDREAELRAQQERQRRLQGEPAGDLGGKLPILLPALERGGAA
ncbi:MAG TPA: Hsp70 family protein [Vicinamibacterales bacterium]|jgi:molecular chaperone DnaK (HSP70)